MEEEKIQESTTESTPKEELKYTQSDVDNIVNKAKENMRKKLVDIAEYEKLANELSEIKNQQRVSQLEKIYLENGGNKTFFNDFLKVNPNINDKDVKDKMNSSPWVFMSADYNSHIENQLSIVQNDFDENQVPGDLYEFDRLRALREKKKG